MKDTKNMPQRENCHQKPQEEKCKCPHTCMSNTCKYLPDCLGFSRNEGIKLENVYLDPSLEGHTCPQPDKAQPEQWEERFDSIIWGSHGNGEVIERHEFFYNIKDMKDFIRQLLAEQKREVESKIVPEKKWREIIERHPNDILEVREIYEDTGWNNCVDEIKKRFEELK